ncbi:hypothetical protein POKO110462_12725 [Pontibacter korlensis]|uniref:Uncharacterized protein n=1 Tax=Pontibacter korlensis TaxID=400092 RepID=A0A0E3ZG90_9BACT|nr:hypothetical protein [Pontibacter korlensis]AKD03999.1 hypothetical protein PKOR_13930 [Pontibacter korlensis]
MKLKGNLQDIKTSRDSGNKEIEIHIDRVEYLTHKKDGKYFQPFNFEDDLDTPLVITGDCLARIPNKHLEEGEYEFEVYDKVGEGYELNPNKELAVTATYDFDLDLTILTEAYYTVTVSNEEFKQIKADRHKAKKGKGRR